MKVHEVVIPLNTAYMESYLMDNSHLDDFSHEDAVELQREREKDAIKLEMEAEKKRLVAIDKERENVVPKIRELMKRANTKPELEIIDAAILHIDEVFPHPTPLWKLLLDDLEHHYDRIERGRIIVHSGVKFPCRLVKGRNEAVAIDKRGYIHWAKQGYAIA